MTLDTVRSTVQPALDMDFDALLEEFVTDTGNDDLTAFLDHLIDFGLIERSLVSDLMESPAEPEQAPVKAMSWDDDNEPAEEDAPVLASAADLQQLAVASGGEAVDTAPEPVPNYENAPTGVGAPERLVGLDFRKEGTDDYTARKRTQFRRRNGQLEETGAFAKSPKRQVRRRPKPLEKTRDLERYNFLGDVGEGAMGAVHLVDDQQLNRNVAYKEMSDEIAENATMASKFLAEAQITAQLEHPNIVPVYAREGDRAYTMKLIRGRTVEDLINEARAEAVASKEHSEKNTLEERLELFLKVCDAMAFSHARGVVHRDLKPENIMVGQFGEVIVMDWGIAHLLPGEFDGKPRVDGLLDEGELVIGTAGYMSPEQAEGKTDELTGASDQYALGLILFELVSLKPAVTGKNQLHILTRQQLGEVNPLVHVTKQPIPSELHAIIAKAVQLEPGYRYATVDEFADDLRRFQRGEAVLAKPDNPWQALVRFTGRHRQATLLVGVSVLFVSLFAVLLLGVWTQVSASRASAREQAVSNAVTTYGRHASFVEGQMVRLQGLLLILATTAEDNLTRGNTTDGEVLLASTFDETPPSDALQSAHYGLPITIERSSFVVPKSSTAERVRALTRLEPMNGHFRGVMLRSQSDEAATFTPRRARRALAEVGTPIQWAYVATTSGAYSVYPGHGGYTDFDPRKASWYTHALAAKGPVWGAPERDDDSSTGEIVVPCTMPLIVKSGDPSSNQDDVLGVVGIDVRYDWLRDSLLVPKAFQGLRLRVVDAVSMKVLFDPEDRSTIGNELERSALYDAVKGRRSERIENAGTLTIVTKMPTLDWSLIVSGSTDAMLAGAAATE